MKLIALFTIILSLTVSACGSSKDGYYKEDSIECSSCFAQEDAYGNQGIVCTNNVPLGVSCYGGLRQFGEQPLLVSEHQTI